MKQKKHENNRTEGGNNTLNRYNSRILTIDAVIVKNNTILLIKRANEPFKDQWALPGGHVEWNEEVADTVKKEVREETGLTVTSMRLLDIYSKPDRDPKQKISLAYIVEAIGEPKAGDDAKAYKWFELSSLPDNLAFDHKQIIADYMEYNI